MGNVSVGCPWGTGWVAVEGGVLGGAGGDKGVKKGAGMMEGGVLGGQLQRGVFLG